MYNQISSRFGSASVPQGRLALERLLLLASEFLAAHPLDGLDIKHAGRATVEALLNLLPELITRRPTSDHVPAAVARLHAPQHSRRYRVRTRPAYRSGLPAKGAGIRSA